MIEMSRNWGPLSDNKFFSKRWGKAGIFTTIFRKQ